MKCIIIDDEPKALDVLELYINKTPSLELSARYTDSFDALSFIQNNKVDLLFLDINMPDLNGIDLLKSLPDKPMVIFTTAYSKYAVESYELQAVDYLIKPIEFHRFLKAVNHAEELFSMRDLKKNLSGNTSNRKDYLFVKSGKDLHKIHFSEINYIEGARNYLIFHTDHQKIMTLMTMKELEQKLPIDAFCRIHKSIFLSLSKIKRIKDNHVYILDQKFPIGSLYKNDFLKKIRNESSQ